MVIDLGLLVGDRFVGNGIFTEAHRAIVVLPGLRSDAWSQVRVGKDVDCDVMRVVLLGERIL